MNFGETLTKLRKERGMSQEELANELNVSRQAVSKWEQNSSYPETDKIVAICKLFNCSMDELIGLKESKKTSNKTLNIINEYFDKFIKGIKMFYSMTFKQKLKCLIEMGFYFLILIIIFIIADVILVEVVKKLLYILPNELLFILIQIFEGLFYIIYLAFMIYVLIKLYKVRYLDYYEDYLNALDNKVETINEEKKETTTKRIKIKEEKIIIRDENNEFKPFMWMKKALIIFCKFITFCILIALSIAFVLLIAFTIFTLYFVSYGIIILFVVLALIGSIIGLYIFIEIFIKFIFNMKQSPKRLFITFIFAMLLVGISSGLFASEIASYKIIDNLEYDNLLTTEELKMEENLVIDFINYADTVLVFEEREDILIEFYGTKINQSTILLYEDSFECTSNLNNSYFDAKNFKIYSYHYSTRFTSGSSINDVVSGILEGISTKTIYTEEQYYIMYPKIYISKENYEKILKTKISLNSYLNNDYIYCE